MMTVNSLQSPIQLDELLHGFTRSTAVPKIAVSGLSIDSRQVQAGDVFLALKGCQHDGLQFAQMVLEKGVAAIVHESFANDVLQRAAQQRQVPLIHVPDLSKNLGYIASRFYAEPSKHMQIIGVTGTDGKTSVSHFIAQSLAELNQTAPCGLIGTLGNGLYGDLQTASLTTPDALTIQSLLSEMRNKNAAYAVMEASSHGLEQRRVNGVQFDIAVLTNLGRDHLDYHADLDEYKEAKQLLFALPGLRSATLNVNDGFGRELLKRYNASYPISVYGLDTGGQFDRNIVSDWVFGNQIVFHAQGFTLQVDTPDEKIEINSRLFGEFNALNMLAVIAVLRRLGFSLSAIKPVLDNIQSAPGRMQLTAVLGRPAIVVDYAHTPQALRAALQTLKKHCQGRLWCVFGCGGNRDAGKRPLMGQIAERYADHTIITDDNPRHEDPIEITRAIKAGIKHDDSVEIINDRQQAIEHAITYAHADDVVLIAGKGHESYQQVGNERYDFSDQAVVNKLLGLMA